MPVNLNSERIYVGRIASSRQQDDVGGYAVYHERPLSSNPSFNDVLYHGFDRGRVVAYLQALGNVVPDGRLEVVNGIEVGVIARQDAGIKVSKLPDAQFRSLLDDADVWDKVFPIQHAGAAELNGSRAH